MEGATYSPLTLRSGATTSITTSDQGSFSYLSELKKWQKEAPSGENRTDLADELQNAYENNLDSVFICNSSISSLPPIPPKTTNLVIVHCDKLTSLAGITLTEVTFLRIDSCSQLTTFFKSAPDLDVLMVIECNELNELLIDISKVTKLIVRQCNKLAELTNYLPNIVELDVDNCPSFDYETWIHNLYNLLPAEKSPFNGSNSNHTIDSPMNALAGNYRKANHCAAHLMDYPEDSPMTTRLKKVQRDYEAKQNRLILSDMNAQGSSSDIEDDFSSVDTK